MTHPRLADQVARPWSEGLNTKQIAKELGRTEPEIERIVNRLVRNAAKRT